MRILVTGAAGFIGRHLVDHLREYLREGLDPSKYRSGHDVVITDIAPLEEVADHAAAGFRWNIRDHKSLPGFVEEARGCDAVIHLAAIAAPRIAAADPETAWDTNVRGTANVLELAKRAGIRHVVFFSSAHVYGISPKYLPTDETAPLAMHDTYTVTKILGEELCWLFWQNHGIIPTVLRLWNAYGPGQNPDYFLGAKLAEAQAAAVAMRAKTHDGWHAPDLLVKGADITKDFVHVSDVVRAARLAVESSHVGELNVGTGVETRLGDLGIQIGNGFGVGVASGKTDDAGPTRMRCDPTRIKTVLGWESTVKVEDGLADLIRLTKAAAGLT